MEMPKNSKDIKKWLKWFWWFVWESESVWSYLVNIVLAFVVIYFIIYPGIGLVFGTASPIVAVVSESMEHDGDFDTWWESQAICGNIQCTQEKYYNRIDITKDKFLDFKYKNGFNKGDIMVLKGSTPEDIDLGDIIVFKSNRPYPIIHRVIKIWKQDNEYYFQTKGDHNTNSITSLGETKISHDKILGKAIIKIPLFGYIKIYFMDFVGTPYCKLTNNLFPCRRLN